MNCPKCGNKMKDFKNVAWMCKKCKSILIDPDSMFGVTTQP